MSVRVYWQGEALDRLRDERHAAIVERVLRLLTAEGWIARTEVSFSEYGERGSIDVFALHPKVGALLVIEVKSAVPDLQATLSNLDRKTRLAPGLARALGWESIPCRGCSSSPMTGRRGAASRSTRRPSTQRYRCAPQP